MPPYRALTRGIQGILAQSSRAITQASARRTSKIPALWHGFHTSPRLAAVKPFLLADIGEGIRECEVIQWFVQPGARVEQFDPLCEVQSDKASVEITSRFDGVIKKLHYEAGEMAAVGKPLVDIDIQDEVDVGNEPAATASAESNERERNLEEGATIGDRREDRSPGEQHPAYSAGELSASKHAKLATPAVRHLTRELKVDIGDILGTGKDRRVLKEDVYRFVQQRSNSGNIQAESAAAAQEGISKSAVDTPPQAQPQHERAVPLTAIQHQMFKTMTRSLSIPHFVYADEYNLTKLTSLRSRLNKHLQSAHTQKKSTHAAPPPRHSAHEPDPTHTAPPPAHLTLLPFILKALSLALHDFPLLNARLDSSGPKPHLIFRQQHDMGIAVATPDGLLVPVLRAVDQRSILSIAAELHRLQALARAGALAPADLAGSTVTVSNIGAVGGTYVAPVIVPDQVAILGVGRARTVPAFEDDGDDGGEGKGDGQRLVKRVVGHFSWSADHRVVDGAVVAAAAERVRAMVEEPELMLAWLR